MILNHESPAGCIKIVAKSLHLVFATFVLSVYFFYLFKGGVISHFECSGELSEWRAVRGMVSGISGLNYSTK